tara:strand:- start:397 stop:1485 length:1089 start_codon:yes stop_codon:yes gene_type:complete
MLIEIPKYYKKIIVTGGAGFIGGCLIRKILNKSEGEIFNIDKFGYASDLTGIDKEIELIGNKAHKRHHLIKIDISNKKLLSETIKRINPDLVFHLAAESHVDRSISGPDVFIKSNIIGTFNLLEVLRTHFANLSTERKKIFRLHHVSTDEVFGSAEGENKFSELSPYNPKSPYSASKASSDHLVRAWQATYQLPISISNCSNNYGPWQLPDKLIPLIITKAVRNEPIPIYGNGENIRDWLFVEDHVEAMLEIALKGIQGSTYCIGGSNEYSNLKIAHLICDFLNKELPKSKRYNDQITFVKDRPGHDFRYAIDNSFIIKELKWQPKYTFEKALVYTIRWYLENLDWCSKFLPNKDLIRKVTN